MTTCAGGHGDHHTYTKYMDKEPRKIRKIFVRGWGRKKDCTTLTKVSFAQASF